MNNVYFPVQVVALLRRLVMATFSLSGQYHISKVRIEDASNNKPRVDAPDITTTFKDSWWNPLARNWLRVGSLVHAVLEQPTTHRSSAHPHWASSEGRYFFADDANARPPSPSRVSKVLTYSHTRSELASEKLPPTTSPEPDHGSDDTIHRLLRNPTLYDPIRTPRFPIVLCHGLYGFDVRGPAAFPSLRLHYWSNVLNILRKKVGADVIVTSVPGTGSIASRAKNLDQVLREKARGRGINFMAHSMGGLDCRYLITHVQPNDYVPLSLTTISTPHRGSPFMDWCAENIGLGRQRKQGQLERAGEFQQEVECDGNRQQESTTTTEKRDTSFSLSLSSLPSSFTTLLLSIVDSPAYANLTTSYLNDVFNPTTPNDPRVKYFSVTGRTGDLSVWHPLWLPKMILDELEHKAKEHLKRQHATTGDVHTPISWEQDPEWGNDGLVSVESAKWGEFLGIMEGCDHWEIRGARGLDFNVDLPSAPLASIANRIGADGWALGDWSKFIRAWKKQEAGASDDFKLAGVSGSSMSSSDSKVSQGDRDEMRRGGERDPVVKASTDKLSAVFDWMIDQDRSTSKVSGDTLQQQQQVKKLVKNELASKLDLERFFVALSRKLYDEGL